MQTLNFCCVAEDECGMSSSCWNTTFLLMISSGNFSQFISSSDALGRNRNRWLCLAVNAHNAFIMLVWLHFVWHPNIKLFYILRLFYLGQIYFVVNFQCFNYDVSSNIAILLDFFRNGVDFIFNRVTRAFLAWKLLDCRRLDRLCTILTDTA